MISIIVPVYNAENWLEKTLESIVNQTLFDDIEVVLVNDGSLDKSGMIIDEYIKKYDNIIGIHIENQGVSNARNVGINICHGEFITFIDADDYVDVDFVENLYKSMDENCDIVCGGFIAEYHDKSIKRCPDKEYIFENEKIYFEFLKGDVFDPNVTDKLFRRNVVGEEKFDLSIAIAEDKLFLFHCLKRVKKIKFLPVANYHYVMNDLSACRKDFTLKKYHSVYVADKISEEIKCLYPEYKNYAESMAIDVKCRVYGEIYRCKAKNSFNKEFLELKRNIKNFGIIEKYRYSNRKHFFAFLVARIHPALYCFLKNEMKLQYKN